MTRYHNNWGSFVRSITEATADPDRRYFLTADPRIVSRGSNGKVYSIQYRVSITNGEDSNRTLRIDLEEFTERVYYDHDDKEEIEDLIDARLKDLSAKLPAHIKPLQESKLRLKLENRTRLLARTIPDLRK